MHANNGGSTNSAAKQQAGRTDEKARDEFGGTRRRKAPRNHTENRAAEADLDDRGGRERERGVGEAVDEGEAGDSEVGADEALQAVRARPRGRLRRAAHRRRLDRRSRGRIRGTDASVLWTPPECRADGVSCWAGAPEWVSWSGSTNSAGSDSVEPCLSGSLGLWVETRGAFGCLYLHWLGYADACSSCLVSWTAARIRLSSCNRKSKYYDQL